MRASTLDRNKFEVLKAKAFAYDIDPADDYMRPGNNPAETAFQLLRHGLDMLLFMTDNGFPTLDSRTRKKVPKYVRQSLLFYGWSGMLIFAQTLPLLYVKEKGHLSGDEPPELTVEHHRKLYDTVSSFYPFKRMGETVDEPFLRQYKVLEEHELPQEVVDGEQPPANEYSEALLRGENPDERPELVAKQREFARDFFIEKATTRGIKLSLNPNDRKLLASKFASSQTIEDASARAEFSEMLRAAWIEGSKEYLAFARLDA
jgi:hypothetical protein